MALSCPTCAHELPEGAQSCPQDGTPVQLEPTRPRVDPLIGLMVGEYRITERIGEGGMGLVYRGVQPTIQKKVSIKILRPEFASDPAQVQRLIAEAQAVNAIGHRGIVDIFGFGNLPDGRQYIVMELLEGQPLDALLRARGPFPIGETLFILDEICAALDAAHGAGVVHRDLKPSNVFLVSQPDGTRYIKLLDFGLAKRAAQPYARTHQTSTEHIVGTPDCMAPEQIRGEPVGPPVDLYALGVLAFEMLAGRLPFEAATSVEMLYRHLDTPAPSLRQLGVKVPASLDQLVAHLLEKVPENRPSGAVAVRLALKAIGEELEGLTPSAVDERISAALGPEVHPAPIEGPTRRLLWLAVAVGLCLLAASGAVLWATVDRSTGPIATPAPAERPSAAAPIVPSPPPAPEVTPLEPLSAQVAPPKTRAPGVPSSKMLLVRVNRLEQRMKRMDNVDPSAATLLSVYRGRAKTADSAQQRLELKRALDDWERQFLRR